MTKSKSSRGSSSGQFIGKSSMQSELETFRDVVAGLKKNPSELRTVTVMAGISTPKGRLKKAYRSG